MLISDLVVGDTDSEIVITCFDVSGKIIDLTDINTVFIRWRINNSAFQERNMVPITPLTDGRARYLFLATDLIASGIMYVEFTIRSSGSPFIREVTSAELRTLAIRDRV